MIFARSNRCYESRLVLRAYIRVVLRTYLRVVLRDYLRVVFKAYLRVNLQVCFRGHEMIVEAVGPLVPP